MSRLWSSSWRELLARLIIASGVFATANHYLLPPHRFYDNPYKAVAADFLVHEVVLLVPLAAVFLAIWGGSKLFSAWRGTPLLRLADVSLAIGLVLWLLRTLAIGYAATAASA
ncbi:hypothetical protein [Thiohalorhabdus methylotrophus]|uniref:Uncharacterized protein n=1 Tax=Thiohalorhabdus methylotrophus TaxID=3242694 RepID=A0ABV4TT15_9GAMM